VRVSEAQVARAQNTLDVVRAQVEAGVSPRKDNAAGRGRSAHRPVQLLQARNNADLPRRSSRTASGWSGDGRLTLADVPAPTAATPATATLAVAGGGGSAAASSAQNASASAGDVDIADYTALAYRARPDIARSLANVDINRASVGLARINSGVLVTSDTALGYQFSPNTGNNREITAQVSYPLFDAGLARAQVRGSEAAVRASELRLESLRQQVAVEVEQAYRLLTEARARVPAAELAQRAAQLNYEAALESRREGVGSIIDVIQAQTLLVQAETNYVQAIYDFYGADARLARAVGQADRIADRASAGAPSATPDTAPPQTPSNP
jgi:outer membrane protein TolC